MTAVTAIISKRKYNIEFDSNKSTQGTINGKSFEFDMIKEKLSSYHALFQNKSFNIELEKYNPEEKEMTLSINGSVIKVQLQDHYDVLLEKMGLSDLAAAKVSDLKAPMPGLVLDIVVAEGDSVSKGDPLLILEAMKMENVLKSPTDGVIKKIAVSKGNSVDKNALLLKFE